MPHLRTLALPFPSSPALLVLLLYMEHALLCVGVHLPDCVAACDEAYRCIMPKKLPLGRRHKNGTGDNQNVEAKREIVHTQVGCAKKSKKKPKPQPLIDYEKAEDALWADYDAKWDAFVDEAFKPVEKILEEILMPPPPTPPRQHL